MENIIIREMVEDDIYRGFLDVLEELSEVNLTLEAASLVFVRRKASQHLKTFVAVDVSIAGGRVVGTASLLIEQKYIHAGGKAAFLEDVAVHDDYQGMGIGQALVEHAVAVARAAGTYKVVLCCYKDVVPFYEGCSFYRNGRAMRRDIPGVWLGFKKDVWLGNVAEAFVVTFFGKYGIELTRNASKLKSELALWDLRGEVSGRRFTAEVKWDVMAAQTGNLAIEYYNPKACRPSGIEVTSADVWVTLIGPQMQGHLASVMVLRDYVRVHEPAKLITDGGDYNSCMKLYRAEEILRDVFWPMDGNLPEVLKYLLAAEG